MKAAIDEVVQDTLAARLIISGCCAGIMHSAQPCMEGCALHACLLEFGAAVLLVYVWKSVVYEVAQLEAL
jgi:hypothetical protein